jgi:hypothetical protein
MLAQNPKTGAPIRIMRTEASLWRNQKTMVWLKGDTDSSVSWDRWLTVVIGVEDWKRFSPFYRIDHVILLDDSDETCEWLKTKEARDTRMIFVAKKVVQTIGDKAFRSLGLGGVICLEEILQLFPYTETGWKGTAEDAVYLVGAVFRVSRIGGIPETERAGLSRQGFQITFTTEKPHNLWLIQQYYRPEKAKRRREIQACLQKNLECRLLDKIILLNEEDVSADFPRNEKIHQEVIGERLKYATVIKYIYEKIPPNTLCIFANSDIYMDESWEIVWSVEMRNVFLSLLRWDVEEIDGEGKLFGPRPDSQDTWAILSDTVKKLTWSWESLMFPFGQAGCDNAINIEMFRQKCLVVNPAYSIKTYHYHTSGIRSYDPLDVVDKPIYLYCNPTGIHDMYPRFDLKKYEIKVIEKEGFDRPIYSRPSKMADTFCKMLKRGERYDFEPNSKNTTGRKDGQKQKQKQILYKYENAFQTAQGLMYGYQELFIGNSEESKKAWSKSDISSVTPSFRSECSLAVPLSTEVIRKRERYMTEYLGKILLMWKQIGGGDFWGNKDLVDVLDLFSWGSREVPILPHEPNRQVWSKKTYSWGMTDSCEITKEEVNALREACRMKWESSIQKNPRKWVLFVDEKRITTRVAKQLEQRLESFDINIQVIFAGRTSPERIVEKMLGAEKVVVGDDVESWGWTWLLPEGARMIEVQNEMEPSGEGAHFAGAAGLEYFFVSIPRAREEATLEMTVKRVLDAFLEEKEGASCLPVIYVPRRNLEGFYGHPGDSFREMLRLWADRGYVNLEEHEKAVQIWLNKVGDVLLYDRPTLDWFMTAPMEEQNFRLGLFGNPKAPFPQEKQETKSWFFWPRRPELVEEIVEEGLPKKGWNERTKGLVFYGKIENRVQERRRKQHDWASVCNEFFMANGMDEKYPFTQREYLENLTSARFGLCLAGFGKKCHREIECMAMGCVPIITDDVDMNNYSETPICGVHYLKGSTPTDVKIAIENISNDKWEEMSSACQSWWKRNASVEGSWLLTKRLAGLKI